MYLYKEAEFLLYCLSLSEDIFSHCLLERVEQGAEGEGGRGRGREKKREREISDGCFSNRAQGLNLLLFDAKVML